MLLFAIYLKILADIAHCEWLATYALIIDCHIRISNLLEKLYEYAQIVLVVLELLLVLVLDESNALSANIRKHISE
jgi:hypothetical protein